VAQSIDGAETAFTWDQALDLPQALGTSDGTLNLYGLRRRSGAAGGVAAAPWGRLAVVQGDTWYYPQHDALGSVRQWTDALGVVLATQAYSPFGVPRDPLGVAPWGFTGEWHDPMGMVYLRARWYNPALGRFTQVDPFPGLLSIPATRHPYAYALNAPLRYADPSGEFVIEIVVLKVVGKALISAGVGAAAGAVSGGIAYVIANPGRSFREYVRDEAFQRAVLSGAAGGAVSGLIGGTLGALGRLATFWGAAGGGAASGFFGAGAGKITYNLLTPCTDWHAAVLEAMVWGGVAGGATAGLWYGARQWLRGAPTEPSTIEPAWKLREKPVHGTEVHHLVEQRFAHRIGVAPDDILSVRLDETYYQQQVTARLFRRGNLPTYPPREYSVQEVWEAYKRLYRMLGQQDWLEAIWPYFPDKGVTR
jgi:RHS repeat-associated protein